MPLEWRQVDFTAGEVRLDAGTTKKRDGRVFPLTDDLRTLLETQHAEHLRLKHAGQIAPWVFFRMVASKRRWDESPEADSRLHTGVESGVSRGRVSRSHSA